MVQQESTGLFCQRPPNHGKGTAWGFVVLLSPAKNTHQPTHAHKTHTPTVLKLTLSIKPCSFSRASLNKVVFSPNWDCGRTEQSGHRIYHRRDLWQQSKCSDCTSRVPSGLPSSTGGKQNERHKGRKCVSVEGGEFITHHSSHIWLIAVIATKDKTMESTGSRTESRTELTCGPVPPVSTGSTAAKMTLLILK